MDAQPGTIAVYDPSTEQQISEIADGGARAVDEAVASARETFVSRSWHGKTPSERTRILFRAADLIEQRADELGAIDSRNVGMSRNHARNLVFAAADQVRYYAGWCAKIYGKSAQDGRRNHRRHGGSAGLHAEGAGRCRRMHRSVERSGAQCDRQAGTVWLNAQFAWDPAMPFGGYKQSGWEQEYGLEGVEAYMKTKSVYVGI